MKEQSKVRKCKRCTRFFADAKKHKRECRPARKKKPLPPHKWNPKRPGKKPNRGKDWRKIQAANLEHCEVEGCTATSLTQTAHIHRDHIIPFRLAEKWGDPNDERNLICICNYHHGRKNAIEDRLFEGDVLGFALGLIQQSWNDARIERAFALYGLRWPLSPTGIATTPPNQPLASLRNDESEAQAIQTPRNAPKP